MREKPNHKQNSRLHGKGLTYVRLLLGLRQVLIDDERGLMNPVAMYNNESTIVQP